MERDKQACVSLCSLAAPTSSLLHFAFIHWLSSLKATNIYLLFAFDSLLCWVLYFYLYAKQCHAHNMLEIYAIYSSNISSSLSSEKVTNIVSIFLDRYWGKEGQRNLLVLTRDCWSSSVAANTQTCLISHTMLWAFHQSHSRSIIMVGKSGFREMVTCPSHTAGREHSKS